MKQWVCQIDGARLRLGDRDGFAAYVGGLKDGTYLLRLSRPGAVRSPEANGWYWAGLSELADDLGYDDPKELHEIFKARFLGYDDDAGHPRIGSTAKLTTGEFLGYLDKVNRFCLDRLGRAFPLPKTADR